MTQRHAMHWIVLVVTMGILFGGCATNGVIKDRVEPVKTVAIVGFELDQQQIPASQIGAPAQSKFAMPTSMITMPPREAATARELYTELSNVLTNELKWKVVDIKSVAENAAYHDTHEKIAKMLMFNHGRKPDWDAYLAEGIVPAMELNSLDAKSKEALLHAMGVDAIVVLSSGVALKSKMGLASLVGGKTYIPMSTVKLEVYDSRDSTPIWWDHDAEGDEVASEIVSVKGVSVNTSLEKMDQAPIDASKDAYRVLIERFRKAMASN